MNCANGDKTGATPKDVCVCGHTREEHSVHSGYGCTAEMPRAVEGREVCPCTGFVAAPTGHHDKILKHFDYYHLPKGMMEVSKLFHDLAHHIHVTIPPGPERSVALRKLLEGKDAAVRAYRVPGG